jgi:hypothetical protein
MYVDINKHGFFSEGWHVRDTVLPFYCKIRGSYYDKVRMSQNIHISSRPSYPLRQMNPTSGICKSHYVVKVK